MQTARCGGVTKPGTVDEDRSFVSTANDKVRHAGTSANKDSLEPIQMEYFLTGLAHTTQR